MLDIPAELMQDPQFFRNPELGLSRDGCRVPLPWTREGSSFGFGANGSHLPQPEWYGAVSVEAEDTDPSSTLNFYRKAVNLRKSLVTAQEIKWVNHFFNKNVLHFVRPNGWHNVTNFGTKPVALPKGQVLLSSLPLVDGKLPSDATAWIKR